jgi:hypothetical protein
VCRWGTAFSFWRCWQGLSVGSPNRWELDFVLGSSGLEHRWMTFSLRAKRMFWSFREITSTKSDVMDTWPRVSARLTLRPDLELVRGGTHYVGYWQYRQYDVAIWVEYDQIFPKQCKSQIRIGFYLFWKTRILRFSKPDGLIFMTSASYLIFFYLDPLMPFSSFSYFKTHWIFKSSNLVYSSTLFWNCQNRTV